MDTTDLYEEGLRLRREIAGPAVADAALANADGFSHEMEQMVTAFCWGGIWGRPGLDRRSRSILNIGMLIAANRPEQLAGHIRVALTNGLTRDELNELLLQAAVYLGMPAGLSAFKIAREVLADIPDAADTPEPETAPQGST